MVEAYVAALCNVTEEELTIALETATKENVGEYAPTPGMVLQIIKEMRGSHQYYDTGARFQCDSPAAGPSEGKKWVQGLEWKALKEKLAKRP